MSRDCERCIGITFYVIKFDFPAGKCYLSFDGKMTTDMMKAVCLPVKTIADAIAQKMTGKYGYHLIEMSIQDKRE